MSLLTLIIRIILITLALQESIQLKCPDPSNRGRLSVEILSGNIEKHKCNRWLSSNCSPYVIVSVEGQESRRTSTKHNNKSPLWQEIFTFDNVPKSHSVIFEIWDNIEAWEDGLIAKYKVDQSSSDISLKELSDNGLLLFTFIRWSAYETQCP
jgi:hypothetical protein